ncbi:MAG: hypothetical protein AAF630_03690 [Cyanobacteria bacterium P01_C01_bin.38]
MSDIIKTQRSLARKAEHNPLHQAGPFISVNLPRRLDTRCIEVRAC